MYSQCSRFHPKRFTFGGVIAERVNTVFRRTVFPLYRLFEPIINWLVGIHRTLAGQLLHLIAKERLQTVGTSTSSPLAAPNAKKRNTNFVFHGV